MPVNKLILKITIFNKVNCVVMRGLNEDEVCNFVEMTQNKVSCRRICNIYYNYYFKYIINIFI